MAKSIKERWADIHKKDMEAEELAKEWLEKIKKFKIEYWHEKKRSNKPYDIIAEKDGKKWAIEVKSGISPPIKLKNFKHLLNKKNIDMIGLILIIEGYPHLLHYNKHTYFGEIAWMNKRKHSEWWSEKHKIRSKRK